MCFGKSKLDEEEKQMTTRSKNSKPKLKRRRSPAAADHAGIQNPRKLSKLDSTTSALASNRQENPQTCSQKLPDSLESPKPSFPPLDNADNDFLRMKQLESIQLSQESINSPSKSTVPLTGCEDDTPLEQRTAIIESYHASQELCSHVNQGFVDISFHPALYFQLLRSTKMRNDELAVCFDLIAKTSQQDYKTSSRGWHPAEKMEEMQDKQMMYLLVRQAEGYRGVQKIIGQGSNEELPGDILGFLSFKFEPEDEPDKMKPVQYIYEIHLDDRLRRQSLGGRMIKWAESQARLVNIAKVMLTVFTINEGARKMYEREGFVKDESSPEDRITRRKIIKADYIIMSKEL